MNLKSKLFGFGAAAALALSMTVGGASAEPVSLTLWSSACGAHAITGINLGTLTYHEQGDTYGQASANGTLTMKGNVDGSGVVGECSATITVSALTDLSAPSSPAISASKITLKIGSDVLAANDKAGTRSFNTSSLTAGGAGYDVQLQVDVPIDAPAGTYTGTITVADLNVG